MSNSNYAFCPSCEGQVPVEIINGDNVGVCPFCDMALVTLVTATVQTIQW